MDPRAPGPRGRLQQRAPAPPLPPPTGPQPHAPGHLPAYAACLRTPDQHFTYHRSHRGGSRLPQSVRLLQRLHQMDRLAAIGVPTKKTSVSVLTATAKFIHQPQNAFANLEQFFSRFDHHRIGQKFLWRGGFEAGLGFVQMIQRALQAGDGERAIAEIIAARNAIQRPSELCSRDLELTDELSQFLVARFAEAPLIFLLPVFLSAFKAPDFELMMLISIFRSHSVYACS